MNKPRYRYSRKADSWYKPEQGALANQYVRAWRVIGGEWSSVLKQLSEMR